MRPRIVRKIVRMNGSVTENPPQVLRKLPWKPDDVAFIRRARAGLVTD
jgi:hypothetical protein